MNRSLFLKTKWMIGVGLKNCLKNWLAHPYQNYPQVTPPPPHRGWQDNSLYEIEDFIHRCQSAGLGLQIVLRRYQNLDFWIDITF